MAEGTCSVCGRTDRRLVARGMCGKCYDHLRHAGRLDLHRAVDVGEWVASVVGVAGCWSWTGITTEGYGRPAINGRSVSLHRWMYERFIGPIPEGMTLDHRCHTEALARGECVGGLTCVHRRCANPAHMEIVPGPVNTLRGNGPAPRNAAKDVCDNGHEFDEANTIIRTDAKRVGNRECRECQRQRNRDYRARKSVERKLA